jgi:molecular chaperone GrpE
MDNQKVVVCVHAMCSLIIDVSCFLCYQVPYILTHHSRYSTSIFQRLGFSSVSPQQSDKEVKEPKDQESTSDGSNEDRSSSGSEKASERSL